MGCSKTLTNDVHKILPRIRSHYLFASAPFVGSSESDKSKSELSPFAAISRISRAEASAASKEIFMIYLQ